MKLLRARSCPEATDRSFSQPPASGRHEAPTSVDDSVHSAYWPTSLGLRVVIALSYVVLVPAGLLPMSNAWWAVSGGTLLAYSVVVFVLCLSRRELIWIARDVAPYLDTLVITLAIVALADPSMPIWIGYMLAIPPLSNFHTVRYMLLYSLWSIAMYWLGLGVLDVTGRAPMMWHLSIIVSIFAIFTALNTDVIATSNRRLRAMVLRAARTDPLTGLANRGHFLERLDHELARSIRHAHSVAVLFLDLDDFKPVNDAFGHPAGDRLLVEVAERLTSGVRPGDTVARFGGDEFAVILEHIASADEAAATATRILELLEQPSFIDGSEVPVSASIGIALPGSGETTAGRLLRNADVAMYAAKSRGRGQYEIYDERPRATTLPHVHASASPVASLEDEAEWSRHDALTEAWNHAAIVDIVQREVGRDPAAAVSIVVLDVDGMTEINDTFGHDSGDRALRAVARALARNDAVVGRYGGDRFLVLLPGAHRVGAQAYVADVTKVVDDLGLKDSETLSTIPVSVSAGVAAYPGDAATLEDVIRLAEGALYAAKSRRATKQGEAKRRLADRVGNLTDELIPLLTSPAPLEDKIRLVAERLSDGLGYDAAECTIYGPSGQELVASCALIDGTVTPLVQRWTDEQARDPMRDQTALRVLLARTQRPILIDDLVGDKRIAEHKRQLMAEMGLHGALVVPMISNGELIGELGLGRRSKGRFGPEDARFLSAVAHQVAAMVRMATLVDGLQRASKRVESAQAETVFMLAAAAEAHDRTTGEHLRHLCVLSEALARELGYDDASVRELGLAATLHDIGKISVPDSVLASPLRFDTDDLEITRMWEIMKRHSIWGADFLKDRQGFELAAKVARWHHERWDGRGYPDGLSGEQLPEAVTIVSVADAFDAMVSDRPYRSGRSAAGAVQEIVAYSGKQFNPRVVEALVRLHEAGLLPREADAHERAA
jgi:diguanylate cyclase (GGDEF)-like protein